MLQFTDVVGAAFWGAISAAIVYFGIDVFICLAIFRTFDVFGSLAASFWPVLLIIFIIIFCSMLARRGRERLLYSFIQKKYGSDNKDDMNEGKGNNE